MEVAGKRRDNPLPTALYTGAKIRSSKGTAIAEKMTVILREREREREREKKRERKREKKREKEREGGRGGREREREREEA